MITYTAERLLYDALRKECNGSRLINTATINSIFKWRFRFPKRYYKDILNDFIELGLLKKLGRDTYEILNCRHKPAFDSLNRPFW